MRPVRLEVVHSICGPTLTCFHGEGTLEARAWVEPLRDKLRHGKEQKVLYTLAALLQAQASVEPNPQTRASLRTSVAYFHTHREHLQYQKVHQQGGPIGSSSVESFNSQLQYRFKRTGQFWIRPGLKNLLSWALAMVRQLQWVAPAGFTCCHRRHAFHSSIGCRQPVLSMVFSTPRTRS